MNDFASFMRAFLINLITQERRIIVISTVRSNSDYVTADIRRSLGFVANERRFNG